MSLLSLTNMQTQIGEYHVLHDVSFDVSEGGVFVLLGRNGAGKTTTLRSIMNMWTPSKGSVKFRGKDISQMHTSDIARMGVAFVPEDMGIFGGLTVEENLVLATASGSFDPQRLERILELFPALKIFWNKQAMKLSGGQKQMLSVARAIIEPRDLILIDEPTKGLAPAIISGMRDAFAEIAQNTTILLVEQNLPFALSLGRDMAVIDDGHVVHTGSMKAFAEDNELQNTLLGLA
ncbi:ABC transporter ATP-binding protein [Rhodobacteraceae bacterium RKSG542]|uniref:ABC transporter ATP-binding protein n=1 Tax=Pseudovibrio flavus TaxID=2529854 RepID=UPI0012BCF665|nr:ABC transporter ATP-binding protein [Pseudovibrio flavus]MTI17507.1 ABC transporter ATP-binding protein [Pseudovibrio flavus]